MIPKVIHSIWMGDNPMPELFSKVSDSWENLCSDYKILVWTDEDCIEYLNECIYAKEAYKTGNYAFASDYVRLRILYDHGGIYLDTDMLLLRSLDDLLDKRFLIAYEDWKHLSGGIIGSRENDEYILNCIEKYKSYKSFTKITIPTILTEVFNDLPENKKFHVLPSGSFYPYPHSRALEGVGPEKYLNNNYSHGIHLWDKNWTDE